MQNDVLELYPEPGHVHTLKNLYLGELDDLPQSGTTAPFIYSNFIASLDGRIALPAEGQHTHQVPPAIANQRDWRLFQELAAQADLLITSARYFRQAADAEAQAELPLGSSPDFDDLRAWRIAHEMPAQPDIAIFSASLDIPAQALEFYSERRIIVLTGAHSDADKQRKLSSIKHVEVMKCGENRRVDARLLRDLLKQQGYRRVYAIAGPSVLHTLATGGALDRLYHTTTHCLLGGTEFDTFVWGQQLNPVFALPLRALYLDTSSPPDCGQTLAVYGQ